MTREVQTKAGNHGKVIYYLRNQLRFRIAQHFAMPRGFPTKPRVCLTRQTAEGEVPPRQTVPFPR